MKTKATAYLAASGTVLLWGMSYIWSDRLLDVISCGEWKR